MSEEFGDNFVTMVDENGEEFVLELLETIDYKDASYTAFLPADLDENDPDYGLVLLRNAVDENGDEAVLFTQKILRPSALRLIRRIDLRRDPLLRSTDRSRRAPRGRECERNRQSQQHEPSRHLHFLLSPYCFVPL